MRMMRSVKLPLIQHCASCPSKDNRAAFVNAYAYKYKYNVQMGILPIKYKVSIYLQPTFKRLILQNFPSPPHACMTSRLQCKEFSFKWMITSSRKVLLKLKLKCTEWQSFWRGDNGFCGWIAPLGPFGIHSRMQVNIN